MSKNATADRDLAIEQMKGLVATVGEMQKAIQELAKPRSGAGVNPQQAFAQGGLLKADGTPVAGSGFTTPDGRFVPHAGKRKSLVGWGDYLKDLSKAAKNPESDASQSLMEKHGSKLVTKTALAEGGGTTGGYTVPPGFSATLMALAAEEEIIYPRATTLPMDTRQLQIPALDHTGGAAGASAFLGAVQATWTEEAADRPETEPKFKNIELDAHELSFIALTSNTLLADSALTLDSVLTALFTKAIAWHKDYAFLQGSGVGKPLGILNAPAAIAQNRTTGSHFKLADAANMLGHFYAPGMANGIWVVNQSVIPDLIQLADAGNNVVWIPNFGGAAPGQGGAGMRLPMALFGMPIFFTEKVPALGTKGDVMLVDPTHYLVGERMELQIEVSTHAAFKSNQTMWRIIARLDGQPWLTQSVTLADGATTVSPYVLLN